MLPNKIQEGENILFSISSDVDGQGQCPDADEKWVNASIFNWNDGKLKFNTNWANNPNEYYGSASGFLPK